MPATPAYLDFLLEHLAPLGTITQRRMFGGHCLYCNGTVFALVAASVGLTISNRGWAFASVILIIAGYWALWVLGKNLAGSQAAPEWVAAWLPAMVFGAGSLLSLRRLV